MAKLTKQENIEYEQLRGIEKAAVLVNYLGKDSIKVLFATLDDGDVRKLLNVMQKFRVVPVHVTKKVLEEYYELISETDDYIFSENVFSKEERIINQAKHGFRMTKSTGW
jgi:flagellar motor switch protein FliG